MRSRVLGLGVLLVCACERGAKKDAPLAPTGPIAVRIDERVITADEVRAWLARQPTFVQMRLSTPEKRRELLENMARFEVLVDEARKHGYERDPDVLRTAKEAAVARMIRNELDAPARATPVSDAEVLAYHKAHKAEFDEIRASQIVVRERATADAVAAEARKLRPTDNEGFRALAAVHSVDEDSKERGGDLTYFRRDTTSLPRAVVDAAFALPAVGAVADIVETEKGFAIIRLTGKRPAGDTPRPEVRHVIEGRIQSERRTRTLDAWVNEMKPQLKVEVYEDKLRELEAANQRR